MDSASAQASEVLGLSARAIAQWTVGAYIERSPMVAARLGSTSRLAIVAEVEARLAHLAAALVLGKPARYASHVEWSLRAHLARGASREEFALSLACMREVLAQELSDRAFASLETYLAAGEAVVDALPSADSSGADRDAEEGPFADLAARYMLALLEGDRRGASRLVSEAHRNGTTIEDLYEHVFMRSQARIGSMWHAGEVSIPEEHFCTASTLLIMSQFYERIAAAPPTGRSVLVATVQGEMHEMGARMVADFFEMSGWRSVFLGQSTPASDIRGAAIDFGVDLIALSASTLVRMPDLKTTIATIREDARTRDIPILVGGRAFASEDECTRVGADAMASSGREAVSVGERLVASRGCS
ncbi:MAG: cobalamin-dependent protein [Phycisphaerales bacterium]|nr:cobalamin-dependent protein [Phycisphaerales bacterium]